MDEHLIAGHRFADIDLVRTVRHALDLVDHHDPSGVATAERRAEIAALLDGVDPETADAATLVPIVTDVWPQLLALRGDLLAAGGLGVGGGAVDEGAVDEGVVAALARSAGGVPKAAVERVEVDLGGVVGDRQAAREHHGSPWQALCLWSAEVIETLAADGHPIFPGAAGENVTVAGLDWPSVRPGAELVIGEVRCRVMSWAVPCRKNARWFSDRRFGRIHNDNGDLSRLYAAVLEPGAIAVGDRVELVP